MPVIQIHLMEGRTTAQKQALMREVTRAAAETLGVSPQSVRILLQELQSGHFAVAGEPKYADHDPAANGHAPQPESVTSN
ncbi:4-oxalocrotonate tautomerase [Donghicola tyrosinivorans]|uniref:Tautomerase n=2 Tax=Donghicola tyrosinivorans TaxID=1652492 RepID=A0A2T0WF06_9RHOB|nr:4-oxalocrotonate tautomerase [Donghicola tyrosinivorans]